MLCVYGVDVACTISLSCGESSREGGQMEEMKRRGGRKKQDRIG